MACALRFNTTESFFSYELFSRSKEGVFQQNQIHHEAVDVSRLGGNLPAMPRTVRVEYPGAIYHVMDRGDRRENIFVNDVDRQDLLKTLAEACVKTDWQVHAFCLMTNHYHLVLETPNPNLIAGVAWLQSTYTIRLNNRHNLTGHVAVVRP